MFRKRKKLKADFAALFQSFTPEEQIDLASTLMTEMYRFDNRFLFRVLQDIEIARLGKRAEKRMAETQRLNAISKEMTDLLSYLNTRSNADEENPHSPHSQSGEPS